MCKFKLFLIIIFTSIFLTSCGFAPKKAIQQSNFELISDYSEFNKILHSYLDNSLSKKYTVTITSVNSNRYEEAYTADTISIYRLILTVEFEISKENDILATHTLSTQKFINKPTNTNISEAENAHFELMKKELAKQLIAIVHAYK